jgi:hypothetical protein
MTTKQNLEWHQLPDDGGQVVIISYAVDDEYDWLYCRRHDRNDGVIEVARKRIDPGSDKEFTPWNGDLPDTIGDWESAD